MRYALIDDQGRVVNVMVLDDAASYPPLAGLTLIACPGGVGPGDVWDGQQFLHQAPSPRRQVSASEFQLLLSDEELSAIQLSTDPHVIRLRTWVQTVRSDIDLDDERVVNGLAYLVALGLLTDDRAAQIRM